MAWLGEAYLLAGRPDEAHTQAQRAMEFSRTHKERPWEAYALRLLGEVVAQRQPPHRPKPTTARPSLWSKSWACVRCRRTVISAWVRCLPRAASQCRPARNCLPLSTCTAL